MREVIQKVLEAEAEAKRLVEAAKAEADRLVSQAQQESQEFVARAREEARAEAGRLLDAATRQAEQEKRERLDRAAADIETQIQLDEETRQRAVEAALRCVCGSR